MCLLSSVSTTQFGIDRAAITVLTVHKLIFLYFSLLETACHDTQSSVQINAMLALRSLCTRDELIKVSLCHS